MDIIFIEELKVVAKIGVWEWERRIKQTLILDIHIAFDISQAAQSDNLEDSLSYKDVAKRATSFVQESEFRLIESAAQGVADLILDEFGASWCKVTVNKPKAVENARNVGVTIERSNNSQ